jgi:hypothetical protein
LHFHAALAGRLGGCFYRGHLAANGLMLPGFQVIFTPKPKGDFDLSGEALPHYVSHSQ